MMKRVTVLLHSSYGGHIGRVSLAHIEGICRLDGLLVMAVWVGGLRMKGVIIFFAGLCVLTVQREVRKLLAS